MNYVIGLIISMAAFLLSISCHEFAHGYVAYRLGDPSAKNAGRLTLNPIKHFDLFSILFFLVFRFGWAKGVPVDSRYFKNQKHGMVYTALAGPVTNILLAFLSILLIGIISKFTMIQTNSISFYIVYFLKYMVAINSMLAIFNLLPIPPLDGSKVFYSVFPDRIYYKILSFDRYMMIITLFLVYLGVLDKIIFTGVNNLQNVLQTIANFIIR